MRTATSRQPLALLFLGMSGLALAAGAATPAATSTAPSATTAKDPWALVATLRAALADDAPLQAAFEQTFIPAGFTTGETERGTLALALPDCLRWDYTEPYAKSFLLCGKDAYSWNPGETSGHYAEISARDEPGLDLLLLSPAELRSRYRAAVQTGASGAPEIALAPLSDDGKTPVSATLELDAAGKRLLGLAYQDREGNRTHFAISAYRKLAGDRDETFSPPSAVKWQEER